MSMPPATNADSSAALQAAIDKASGTGREGIVFVPAGRYIVTRTIYLWPGVRLIGYGATRPVFMLAAEYAGVSEGHRRDGDVHGPNASRACRGQRTHCVSSARIGTAE